MFNVKKCVFKKAVSFGLGAAAVMSNFGLSEAFATPPNRKQYLLSNDYPVNINICKVKRIKKRKRMIDVEEKRTQKLYDLCKSLMSYKPAPRVERETEGEKAKGVSLADLIQFSQSGQTEDEEVFNIEWDKAPCIVNNRDDNLEKDFLVDFWD